MKRVFPLVFAALIFMSCSKNDETEEVIVTKNLKETIPYKAISGVDQNLLSLDFYYTSDTATKKPIVVYVHGGAWSIGDKASKINDKVTLFQSQNYIFISVNYRLSPFPYDADNASRIKFPDHNSDVADAIKWIYTNSSAYGGDKNNIVLLGHSAGAHLVSLTGTNHSFLTNVKVPINAIKGVATIDTEGYDITIQIDGSLKTIYQNAFDADPLQLIAASPIKNIKSSTSYPKYFIASRGSAARLDFAKEFADALKNNGVSVTEVNGNPYTHEGINTAIGTTDETIITTPLLNFMKTCFE